MLNLVSFPEKKLVWMQSKRFPKDIRSFNDFLEGSASTFGDRTALSIFSHGSWRTITFEELYAESRRLASVLQTAGLRKGDRVAFLGNSSIEWVMHFFAVLISGGVAVPLDIKLTEKELQNIVSHAQPKFILASSDFREVSRSLRHITENTAKLLIIDDAWEQDLNGFRAVQHVLTTPEDLAVICYTSGTSGAPKGVEIPVRILLFQSEAIAEVTKSPEFDDVMLTILPLNHMYGLSAGLFHCLRMGYELCFVHELTPEAISKCLHERKVTQLLAVPLYVKMVMRGIQMRIVEDKGPATLKAVQALLKSTRAINSRRYKDFLFSSIKEKLGGHLRRFICGGAELESSVFDFFYAINIPVLVGYGLTETGPIISVNTPEYFRRGSVGLPLPGVEVKIIKEDPNSEAGEIITRGDHVTSGYFKNLQLTSESISDDGWFHTGDLGYIDSDGYLYVCGRKKTLIVLNSGKKVHPEEVESVIGQSGKVRLVCVLGLKSDVAGETVTAVVLPTDDEIKNADGDLEILNSVIKSEVEALCAELAPYKRPAHIIVRTKPFVMTTSLKIKRDTLLKELLENSDPRKH